MAAHNELAGALREQRAHLVQRELLLDTVMQNSPVALVLVDAHERVAFANIAARQLFNEGRSLNGLGFGDALARRRRFATRRSAGRSLVLGRNRRSRGDVSSVAACVPAARAGFRLYLLKRLTRELSRQEVSTWKKLIRVSEP